MNQTTKPVENNIESNPIEQQLFNSQSSRTILRLVIPTVILVAFWILTEASFQFEMGMFYRFVTRTVLLLVTLIYFLIWGFTRRHFTFGQRFLAFVMIVGGMIIAGVCGHHSIDVVTAGIIGLPFVISLSVAWLWCSRHLPARIELAGIAVASAVVFGVISQLRWDGLDGRQRNELSWRWTPSPEERFQQRSEPKPAASEPNERLKLVETPADWSSFRGGDKQSVVTSIEFSDWTASPPKELWRHPVGPAWSSVIAIGDFLFTQEQRGIQEAVVCYDANSGQEVWVHTPKNVSDRFDQALSGTGPRATPTFHGNRIYVYGAKGTFECLDAGTGEPYWLHFLFKMANVEPPMWGAATSPTIVDDMVVVFVGGKDDNGLFAFDRISGELRWKTSAGPISYSSPQIMTIAGERQILMHDSEGICGIQIEDGKRLWKHASPHSGSFEPMLQPHLMSDGRMIINWDSGLLCLRIHHDKDLWRSEELWKSTKLKPSFNDFVIHEDHIYGLDDGILCCIELAKGQRTWKRGRYGFGQLLLLPELKELLVLTERGEVVRVALDSKEHREIAQFKAIEGKTWNHPLLVRGRLIVRNNEEMACFEVAKPDEKSKSQ